MHKKIVLTNGLRVILVPRESTSAFTVLIAFKAGSIDETDDTAGISHFFEHMTYKGTGKRKTPYDVAEYLDSIGAEHNAYTGKEYTAYYVKASSQHFERALDFLSDNILHPLLPDEEIAKEKNVILEELKTYNDMPQDKVRELFELAIFGKSNIGRPIIGKADSISAVSSKSLRNYQAQYYHPRNAVICVSGNVSDNEDEVIKKVEKYFDFPASVAKLNARNIEKVDGKKVVIKKQRTEQSNIVVGFKVPGSESKEWYALKLLAKIIGGSMSSRMFSSIREKLGLAYYVSTSYCDYRNFGYIATRAGVDNDKVNIAIKSIADEYRKVLSGVMDRELNNAKEMFRGSIAIEMEDSEFLAEDYALTELIEEKIEPPEELMKKYDSITRKDVEMVAKKYIKDFYIAAIGPRASEDKILSLLTNPKP